MVLVMDKARTGDYQKMTRDLRDAGIRAEMYVGDAGMKAQMKYADKRGALASSSRARTSARAGEVTIKDLLEGARALRRDRGQRRVARGRALRNSPSRVGDGCGRAAASGRAAKMTAEGAIEFEALEAQAASLMRLFADAGYERVAPAFIQPASLFLDRIGETLRARTYVFTDPERRRALPAAGYDHPGLPGLPGTRRVQEGTRNSAITARLSHSGGQARPAPPTRVPAGRHRIFRRARPDARP